MGENKSKEVARVALTQYIHSKNMRQTPERYTILDKVFDIEDHFSIETLYSDLESDGFHVSKATLYNTIQLFVDCGIIRRHQFDGKTSQYEKVSGIKNHHHLICTQCRRIKEVKDTTLVNMLKSYRYSAFNTSYFALYVYGLCSRCSRLNKKIKKNSIKK